MGEAEHKGLAIVKVDWVKGEVSSNLVRVERSSTLQGITDIKLFCGAAKDP